MNFFHYSIFLIVCAWFLLFFSGNSIYAEPWVSKDSLHEITIDVDQGDLLGARYYPTEIFKNPAFDHTSLYPFDMLYHFYNNHITTLNGSTCRYHPTCSEYTRQSITQYGVMLGIMMGAERVMRCNEYQDDDVYDPVRFW